MATYAVSLYLWDRRITKRSYRVVHNCNNFVPLGALSIQAKIPTTSVWSDRNFTEPAFRVVHFDQSGHFGRSDRNVPFHLTKLLSPVSIFCLLLTRTITERGSLGRVCAGEMNSSIGRVKFLKFQTGIFAEWKAPLNYT